MNPDKYWLENLQALALLKASTAAALTEFEKHHQLLAKPWQDPNPNDEVCIAAYGLEFMHHAVWHGCKRARESHIGVYAYSPDALRGRALIFGCVK